MLKIISYILFKDTVLTICQRNLWALVICNTLNKIQNCQRAQDGIDEAYICPTLNSGLEKYLSYTSATKSSRKTFKNSKKKILELGIVWLWKDMPMFKKGNGDIIQEVRMPH